jgi:hypothetical protein
MQTITDFMLKSANIKTSSIIDYQNFAKGER